MDDPVFVPRPRAEEPEDGAEPLQPPSPEQELMDSAMDSSLESPEGTPEKQWRPGRRGKGRPNYEQMDKMTSYVRQRKADGAVFNALSQALPIQTPFDTMVETTGPRELRRPILRTTPTGEISNPVIVSRSGSEVSQASQMSVRPPDGLQNAKDIVEWLAMLGYGKYVDVFEANEVGLAELGGLTEADLTQMGIPLGPRKRMLKAIAWP